MGWNAAAGDFATNPREVTSAKSHSPEAQERGTRWGQVEAYKGEPHQEEEWGVDFQDWGWSKGALGQTGFWASTRGVERGLGTEGHRRQSQGSKGGRCSVAGQDRAPSLGR